MCQYHAVFIPMDLVYNWKSNMGTVQAVLVFAQDGFGYPESLAFLFGILKFIFLCVGRMVLRF